MSLIINALKKAEDNGENYPQENSSPKRETSAEKNRSALRADIFFIAILASVIGVSISFFLISFSGVNDKASKKEVVQKEIVKKEAAKEEKTSAVDVAALTEKAAVYVEKLAETVGAGEEVKKVKKPVRKQVVKEVKEKNIKSVESVPVPKKRVEAVKSKAKPKEKPVYYRKGEYVLNGIMADSEKPMALINNKMVVEGKVVGSLRVLRIKEEEVFVEIDGKQYILTMD